MTKEASHEMPEDQEHGQDEASLPEGLDAMRLGSPTPASSGSGRHGLPGTTDGPASPVSTNSPAESSQPQENETPKDATPESPEARTGRVKAAIETAQGVEGADGPGDKGKTIQPLCGDTNGAAAPPAEAPDSSSSPSDNDDTLAKPLAGGAGTSQSSSSKTSDDDMADIEAKLKMDMRSNVKKPQGEREIADFAARWANPDFDVNDIAIFYGVTERTVRKWRKDFGLTDRNTLREMKPKAANVLRSAEGLGKTMTEATKAAIAMHQMPGGLMDPAGIIPAELLDPLKNKQIVSALEDVRRLSDLVGSESQLVALHRAVLRLYGLSITLTPLHTWSSVAVMAKGMVETLAWTRKLEAGLPDGERDEATIRRQVAAQMMKELAEQLSPEEQAILAGLVKKGADKITASRAAGKNGASGPIEPPTPPEQTSYPEGTAGTKNPAAASTIPTGTA